MTRASNSRCGGTCHGGATWFHNDIKNLIVNGPAPLSLSAISAAPAPRAWKPSWPGSRLDTLSLRADYTYTDAIDAATKLAAGAPAAQQASLTGDWQALPDLNLDATVLVTGPQSDIGRESGITEKLGGYTVLNLAASYRLTDTWSLFGRIENAIDSDYQSPDGFLRPGIGAYGGIKVESVDEAGALAAAVLLSLIRAGGGRATSAHHVSKVCTDELLLDLVPPARIASVTFLSREKASLRQWPQAASIPVNHNTAEEILATHPDLILTDPFIAPSLRPLLAKSGARIVEVPPAENFEQIRAASRLVAKAVGEEARGEALIAHMDAHLARSGGASPGEDADSGGMGRRRLCAGPGRAVRCHADGGGRAQCRARQLRLLRCRKPDRRQSRCAGLWR